MADREPEKSSGETPPSVTVDEPAHQEPVHRFADPNSWIYRERSIGSFKIPMYASPKIQLLLVSFVCFLCPGIFNALSGLGGGGRVDHTLGDHMNIALYSTFAVFGFFGGTFVNRLGIKYTLAFGGIGYAIYAISLLASLHANVAAFNILAGALLGVCAGLLWTAQGTIMLSYPMENEKGRYFAWFWGIFNTGAVIGSLIPLGQNINVRTNKDVTDGTYIAFIALMALGALLALALCNAHNVVRKDGSRVVLMKNPTWQSELWGLVETIRFEPFVVFLFPMFWSSNWFYTYHFNAINGSYFNTRTKSLNSLLYYLAQVIGAFIFGYALDSERYSRSMRAKIGLIFLFCLTFVIWGGGYEFAKTYTREDVANTDVFVAEDWETKGYVAHMFLYIFYGFYDSIWQAYVYWLMGALSNSGRRTANYVGFYKGIQSAGAAVMWSLDGRKLSFMSEFISNWVLLSGSILVAAPVIFFKIKDHVEIEADIAATDLTFEEVAPTELNLKENTV